jgi:hypothetical protein
MTFHVHDRVTTPNGSGTFQGYTDQTHVQVMILRANWKPDARYPAGTYPGKFTSASPTINGVYEIREVEK